MLITINTQELSNACEFGEALRNYCFVPDEYGGTSKIEYIEQRLVTFVNDYKN